MKEITIQDVQKYSEEEDLGNVFELVLRSNQPPLTNFNLQCAKELSQSLEVLSLSRNNITSLLSLSPLSSLMELNLNFNNIGPTLTKSLSNASKQSSKLSPFTNLKKLYLSNNKLENITEFITIFPNLEILCLFRNKLYDLNDTLCNLRGLKSLTGLDLAGNPCTFDNMDYKHMTIQRLKKLTMLDDERIVSLDRELAELHFSKQFNNQNGSNDTEVIQDTLSFSTTNAAAMDNTQQRNDSNTNTKSTKNSSSSSSRSKRNDSLSRPSTAPSGGRKPLGSSGIKLFRSEFLNNHPVMLEYVARGLINGDHDTEMSEKNGIEGVSDVPVSTTKSSTKKTRQRGRRSFVERLRRATSSLEEDEQRQQQQQQNGHTAEEDEEEEEEEEDTDERPLSAGANVNYDPNDPNAIIRRLVHVNEELKRTIRRLRQNGGGGSSGGNKYNSGSSSSSKNNDHGDEVEDDGLGSVNEMKRELNMLRIENSNIYLLRKENIQLKNTMKRYRQEENDTSRRRRSNNNEQSQNRGNGRQEKGNKEGLSLSEALAASRSTNNNTNNTNSSNTSNTSNNGNNSNNNTGSISHRLWDENARLKKELIASNALIGRLHSQIQSSTTSNKTKTKTEMIGTASSWWNSSKMDSNTSNIDPTVGNTKSTKEQNDWIHTLTNNDMLDAGDAEIASLIQRNAKNLSEIRQDLLDAHSEAEREEEINGMFRMLGSRSSRSSSSNTTGTNNNTNQRKKSLQRPSTADPRMKRSFMSSASSTSTNTPTTNTSPGRNLIGRNLTSEDDVTDAKMAIRKAQMEMQKIRRQRAEIEQEEKREQEMLTKRNMARRLAGLPETEEEEESPSRKSDTEETRLKREVREVDGIVEGKEEPRSRILFFNDGRAEN